MAFLSGLRSAFDPSRIAMAQALLNGDYAAAGQLQEHQLELQRQNAELRLRQQAAQRAEQDRADQVWGAKESGVGNPLISALSPGDLSQTLRERYAPHSVSPDATYVTPSLTPGQADATFTAPSAPTEFMKDRAALAALPNGAPMATGFAQRHAFGPDTAVPAGGGVATHDATGAMTWGVQPYSVATAPQTQGAPSGAPASQGGAAALNNPGGMRIPGSTQYQRFATPQAGMAAQDAQLSRYFQRGINTVRSIVETWAPRQSRGGDNPDRNVDNYIAHVAGRLGVNPDQQLPVSAIPQIRSAQDEFETGRRGSAPRARGGVANAPRMPVRVNSAAEAARLPRGTHFITPDGREIVRQ